MIDAQAYTPVEQTTAVGGVLTAFVLLRAFASGCTALSGVEAMSNGVPAFREPQSRNAAAWGPAGVQQRDPAACRRRRDSHPGRRRQPGDPAAPLHHRGVHQLHPQPGRNGPALVAGARRRQRRGPGSAAPGPGSEPRWCGPVRGRARRRVRDEGARGRTRLRLQRPGPNPRDRQSPGRTSPARATASWPPRGIGMRAHPLVLPVSHAHRIRRSQRCCGRPAPDGLRRRRDLRRRRRWSWPATRR
jgi:hypothetical protein